LSWRTVLWRDCVAVQVQVSENGVSPNFDTKTVTLPTQARDKHRENSK
jgi:hypothetical protein